MTPSMLLLLGGLCLFASLTIGLAAIGVFTGEQRSVARSVAAIQALGSAPEALRKEAERPFSERVIAPLGERAVGIGRHLVRANTAEKLQHRLDIAGNPSGWDVNRMIGLKVLGLGVLSSMALLYSMGGGLPIATALLVTTGLGAFGYVLPNVLLYNAGEKRENLMRNALPDAIDLLTISVEAGLGFSAAVSRVAQNTKGPLAEEFSRLLQEMQLGMGRSEAMRAMAERTTLADLKSFCLSMVQADNLGIPVGKVLRIQSKEMRTKRRQRAEEKAQQVPVKIMVPLVLFILPTLFIIVIGPAAITMIDLFGRI